MVCLILIVSDTPELRMRVIVAVPVFCPVLNVALTLRSGFESVSVMIPLLLVTMAVPDNVNPVEQLVNRYWPVMELNLNKFPLESSLMHMLNTVAVAAPVVADPHVFVKTARYL